jgi:hypothetical protein
MKPWITYTSVTVLMLVALAASLPRLVNPPTVAAVDCTQKSCSIRLDYICKEFNSSCLKCGSDQTWCAAAE